MFLICALSCRERVAPGQNRPRGDSPAERVHDRSAADPVQVLPQMLAICSGAWPELRGPASAPVSF